MLQIIRHAADRVYGNRKNTGGSGRTVIRPDRKQADLREWIRRI